MRRRSGSGGRTGRALSTTAALALAACGGSSAVMVPELPPCGERFLPADVYAALIERQRVVDRRYAEGDEGAADLSGLFAGVLPEGARVVEVLRANYLADDTDELLVLLQTEADVPFDPDLHGPAMLADRYGHAWMAGLHCVEGEGFAAAFAPVDLVFDGIPTVRQVDRVLLLDDTPLTAVSVQHELLAGQEMIETVYVFGPFTDDEDPTIAGLWEQFEGVGERTMIPGTDLWYHHEPLSVSGFYPLNGTQVWAAFQDSLAWSFGDELDEVVDDREEPLLDRDEDAPPIEPWEETYEDDDVAWTPSRMLTWVPHGVLRNGTVDVWDPYGFVGPDVPWESWVLLGWGPTPPDCEKRLACRHFTETEQALFELGGERVEWIAGLLATLPQAQAVANSLEGDALITGFSTQFDWFDEEGEEPFPELNEIDPRLRVSIPLPAFPPVDGAE